MSKITMVKSISSQDHVLLNEIFRENKKVLDLNSKKTTNKNSKFKNKDTFHKAIAPLLFMGQVFGALPLAGILKADADSLRFRWFDWRVLYTVYSIISVFVMATFCALIIMITGLDIYKTISVMFYGSAFGSLCLFLKLASRWPALSAAIAKKEFEEKVVFLSYRQRFSLRLHIAFWCAAILITALAEHILSIVARLAASEDCIPKDYTLEELALFFFPEFFRFVKISVWFVPVVQHCNMVSTFHWNFMDLFIIVMSVNLTQRFEHLNDHLDAVYEKDMPAHFWRAAHAYFTHLSDLVRKVDDAVKKIVFLSFANNLYFICFQLFRSLKPDPYEEGACVPKKGVAHYTYFYFSFIFLIGRSLTVSLMAARLHTASRKPANALYQVSSASYCNEVQRFLTEVTTSIVALTGDQFFYVTRGLILTITGTVITYELVLVQIGPKNNTTPASPS